MSIEGVAVLLATEPNNYPLYYPIDGGLSDFVYYIKPGD